MSKIHTKQTESNCITAIKLKEAISPSWKKKPFVKIETHGWCSKFKKWLSVVHVKLSGALNVELTWSNCFNRWQNYWKKSTVVILGNETNSRDSSCERFSNIFAWIIAVDNAHKSMCKRKNFATSWHSKYIIRNRIRDLNIGNSKEILTNIYEIFVRPFYVAQRNYAQNGILMGKCHFHRCWHWSKGPTTNSTCFV